MMSKEEFAALRTDFVRSQQFIEFAHEKGGFDFRCHQNAYFFAGFLQREGHTGIR
jgi:hypothetical protein